MLKWYWHSLVPRPLPAYFNVAWVKRVAHYTAYTSILTFPLVFGISLTTCGIHGLNLTLPNVQFNWLSLSKLLDKEAIMYCLVWLLTAPWSCVSTLVYFSQHAVCPCCVCYSCYTSGSWQSLQHPTTRPPPSWTLTQVGTNFITYKHRPLHYSLV